MKKSIFTALLVSISLMAADNAPGNDTGGFVPIDGGAIFQQHCAICHGVQAEKTPNGIAPIAGMDPVVLALEIRAYRDQNDRTGAYVIHKNSQVMKDATVGLSGKEIVAVAKYVNSLK